MDFCGPRCFQRRQQESWDFLAVELLGGGFRRIVTSDAIGLNKGQEQLAKRAQWFSVVETFGKILFEGAELAIIHPRVSTLIKVAVLGTGSLGKHHARIYSELAATGVLEFAGVFDRDATLGREIARKHGVKAFASEVEAAEAADALSIVTPTNTHFDLARMLLERGRHVLVEKPMTNTGEEAAQLIALAQKRNCTLQVGHVERFNPVFAYLEKAAGNPRFIETHRLSKYPARSMDIGVVLDLMIHDLDVVLAFVRSPVESVDATGIAVLSESEDIANARIKFANGCVANLTASRISPEQMRKIRVFSGGEDPSYVSLDYREQKGYIYRLAKAGEKKSSVLRAFLTAKHSKVVSEFAGKKIVSEPVPIEKSEPLKLELEHFVESITARSQPRVSGESAKEALDLALEITRQIRAGEKLS